MQNNNSNQQNHQELRGLRNEIPVVDEFAGCNITPEPDNSETEEAVMLGVVSNCTKLNVREEPSMDSDIVCEISKLTEVMINDDESTDDFYKICTDSGIEGFCMKQYVTVN